MNTKSLEYFIKVVETNSFSKAAEESFISQSAIYQQIKVFKDEADRYIKFISEQ